MANAISRALGGVGDLLLGQRREDVELGDENERIKKERRAIEEQLLTQGRGEAPTGMGSAAQISGQRAIEGLESAGKSRIASARTPAGKLQAARQGAATEVAGRGEIARGVAQTEAAAQTGAIDRALRLQEAELAQEDKDEADRTRRRRRGLLGVLGTGLGSLAEPQAAALGGTAGTAIERSLRG